NARDRAGSVPRRAPACAGTGRSPPPGPDDSRTAVARHDSTSGRPGPAWPATSPVRTATTAGIDGAPARAPDTAADRRRPAVTVPVGHRHAASAAAPAAATRP